MSGKHDNSPLQRAIKGAGGIGRLASELGISRQAVDKWSEVPPTRVLEVERLSGVSRHELRPDLYPRDAGQGAAA